MATIQESIAITDGVSPIFNRMSQTIDRTVGQFERAANAANRVNETVDSNDIGQHISRIDDAVSSTLPHFNAVSQKVEEIRNRISTIGSGGFNKLKNTLSSIAGQFALGSIIASGIMSVSASLASMPSKLTALSDEYSGIEARLKLITHSQQEVVTLNDMIYRSALDARGSYAGMADAITKIGLTAKEAFPDPKQLVPFVTGIQKLFTIGGTGIEQQKDVMLQLTQALGSGKLQGDEFRSIAEAAPMIEQMVSKYMGVSQGELKALSSEGKITAEIMKNAILTNLDEINDKFKSMPITWGQAWQNMKTVAFRSFVPVFNQLSLLANSPAMASFTNGFSYVVGIAGAAIAGIINNLIWLGGVAGNVGSYMGGWLSAAFIVIAEAGEWAISLAIGFLGVYASAWLAVNGQMILSAGIHATVAAYTWLQNAAMIVLNGQLLLSYVRIGILTAASVIWTAATMGITAALSMLNLTMLLNPAGIVIALVLAVIAVFIAWAVHTQGLRNVLATAFSGMASIAASCVNFMIDRINNLIDVINTASKGINNLFGSNISTVGKITYKADTVAWQKSAGDFVQNFSLSGVMSGLAGQMPKISAPGIGDSLGGGLSDIGKNTKDTADHTGKIKEALDITDEDLKYLRDSAEQEAINKYTTAEVKIDMGGINNTVNSDVDLDGMMRYVNDNLFEAMAAGAEAVHP